MITTFDNFLIEANFQFEHDVERHFDDINFLCFDNEIQKVPIQFVTSKRAKMFVDIIATKNYVERKITMRVVRLCISKNYHFDEQQFRDCLTHEMIHVLLAQRNIYKDPLGQHGIYFQSEMNRINKLNVGIKVGLADDENIASVGVRDELKDKVGNKTRYFLLLKETRPTGRIDFQLSPFLNKVDAIDFWKRIIYHLESNLKGTYYKDYIYEIHLGETNLIDIDNFPIARMIKTAKHYIINKELYDKILSNSNIYENKTLKND